MEMLTKNALTVANSANRISKVLPANNSLTDEDVIRQYRTNPSSDCFEALYNRYVNKVYRRCLSMTKSTEQAEDFTHDIFIKVFNKLDAFQERSTFSTWLYSIAFNYCSDQLRIAKRVNFSSFDEGLLQKSDDSSDAHLREEALQLVGKITKSLSADEQTLLQLKYEEGRSIDEIAQTYNISSSAVKMRLKRSRDKIEHLYLQQHPA